MNMTGCSCTLVNSSSPLSNDLGVAFFDTVNELIYLWSRFFKNMELDIAVLGECE